MKILIITGSPNKNGLTAACGEQARLGAVSAGAEAEVIGLNDLGIGMCRACGNGWGPCLDGHSCQTPDGFQRIHEMMREMDGFVLVTPVYWGEPSETAKAFLDRARRCEAPRGAAGYAAGKPVLCVAAAGGSGNGCVSCLASMERFVDHVRGAKFDFIGVTQKNREYKLKTICEAARAMAESLGTPR